MLSSKRTTASASSVATSYASNLYKVTTTTTSRRPRTGRKSNGRSGGTRPRTGVSTIAGIETQQVVCAVSESRGIAPTVGLAFVNLETSEAVLCQISDTQTYVRTIHKLRVYEPSDILIVSTAANPKSKLFSIIEENLAILNCNVTLLDRKYWAETTGLEYIQQLALSEDVEALKVSVGGNYFAVCCIAAALKYIELVMSKTFPYHSLRMKYEPSEGSMMIDLATIQALELVQNIRNPKSPDCLFGLLNETLTPMGARLLKSNILQPLTDLVTLNVRCDALEELTLREEMFFATREALKAFLDVDRILTQLISVPAKPSLIHTEQAINNIIMLKQFVGSVGPIHEALTGAKSDMLQNIREVFCAPDNVEPVLSLVSSVLNEDTAYASQPLDLRNQRTYAVKSGVNGLLDVARQTYKEATQDAYEHVSDLAVQHDLTLDVKFDNARQFYIRLAATDLEERSLPPVFTNVIRKKAWIECQTLDLMKLNQKITDSHVEVLLMSDKAVQDLVEEVRSQISILFKICESIAMLDMLAAFAHLATSAEYVRPNFTGYLAIKSGRHPIREKIQSNKFIPNDVYATQQTRFQIITGCNMSGKSTYIRSVALMVVMAHIGSFVPAAYASFPILHQLFARVSTEENIESNVSTFAAEMREIAFILRNIDRRSLAIIDELGRGTSRRDGLTISLAISEALLDSRALVWFATHFADLASILAERNGVANLHLAVDLSNNRDSLTMLYKVEEGAAQERHYGLSIARVVPLPPQVFEHAKVVAEHLERHFARKKTTSEIISRERRKNVILGLKEQLTQAHHGCMSSEALRAWLKELQREFVLRMTVIDEESVDAQEGMQVEGNTDEMDTVVA